MGWITIKKEFKRNFNKNYLIGLQSISLFFFFAALNINNKKKKQYIIPAPEHIGSSPP